MAKATDVVDFFLTDPCIRFFTLGRFETKVKPSSSREKTGVDADKIEIISVGFEGSSELNPGFSTKT